MGTIYDYLRPAFGPGDSQKSSLPFILLVLLTIPLSYFIGNLALALFFLMAVVYFRKINFNLSVPLVLPAALYILMLLSYIWSIDRSSTLSALGKELPLLLIPIAFLLYPTLSALQKNWVLKYYSWGITFYCIFYLAKAVVRFAATGDHSVFFYHELVTKDVNAIHVSVYVAVAFFYFYNKVNKKAVEYAAALLLLVMVFLLSSKNIIIVIIGLIVLHQLFYTRTSKKLRLKNLMLLVAVLIGLTFVGKIKDRFKAEYETMMTDSSVNDVLFKPEDRVYNVSIKQAWTNESFKPNDYFTGTAFRVYQFRIFTEMLRDDAIFFIGYGLNASYTKIEEKTRQYNLFLGNGEQEGYHKKNFHNQYIQNFAELGIVGLLLLLAMLFISLKKGIQSKDFVHIAFSILMISLFLTESFLWRQRGVMFFTMMYCLFNSRTILHPTNRQSI